MAKLNYSKPLFGIRPIPLSTAGTGGGCAQNSTSGDYVCPVKDEYGWVIFVHENEGCEWETQADETTICYTVLDKDFNVYNS